MAHPYLLLTLATLFWAGNWVAGRVLADLVPPAALTFWRWAIALAILAPLVGPRLWARRELLRRHWKPIAVIGLLGGGLHNILQYWGLHYTSATNGAILNSLTPVFILILGAVFLKEGFSLKTALGSAIALLGALVIATRLDVDGILALQVNIIGDLLVVLSLVMLAGYTVALRWRPQGLDGLSFLACFALVAELPVGLLYAVEPGSMVLNATSLLGLAYVAIFPALLSYHFWATGIAAVGAARGGVFLYLTPVFGSLLAVAFLGERFGLHHAVGMALIFTGVTLASRKWAG